MPGQSSKKRGYAAKLLLVAAGGFFLLVVALIISLLVSEGNGKAAWTQYKAEWEKKGEVFDWRATIPPEVPEHLNFIKHPVFDNIDEVIEALDLSDLIKASEKTTPPLDWTEGRPVNLSSVLGREPPVPEEEALKIIEAFMVDRETPLAQLAEAARRPECRFDLDYETGGIFDERRSEILALCTQAHRVLRLRGLASLRQGDAKAALEDWETIEHLAQQMDQGLGLIDGILSVACSKIGMQILWEGLNSRQWKDHHLERAETLLASRDYQESVFRHFREERAGFIFIVEEYLIHREKLPLGYETLLPRSWQWVTKGWFYRNLVSYCGLMQRFVLAPDGVLATRIDYAKLQDFEEALRKQSTWSKGVPHPHHFLAPLIMPPFDTSAGIILSAQASLDMARLAIAAEQHRRRTGSYPASLSELDLTPLPNDPISGEPYHYRLKDDATPLIYSIGANQIDDGGTPGGTNWQNWQEGDWVWQYSETLPTTRED